MMYCKKHLILLIAYRAKIKAIILFYEHDVSLNAPLRDSVPDSQFYFQRSHPLDAILSKAKNSIHIIGIVLPSEKGLQAS